MVEKPCPSPDGGIGRRARLKLVYLGVWVRFPLRVQNLSAMGGFLFGINCHYIGAWVRPACLPAGSHSGYKTSQQWEVFLWASFSVRDK